MPIIARLSKRFYDQFGEDVVNELVEWLNQVDLAYRSGFREINEQGFERFDAKLEQRIGEINARIDKTAGELNARIDKLAAELNARIDKTAGELNARIDKLDSKFEQRFTRVDARFETMAAHFEQRFAQLEALVQRELRSQQRVTIGLAVGLWMSLLVPLLGLYAR